MSKKLLVGLAIAAVAGLYTKAANAQGMAVNATGAVAAPSAMLDVNSTSQGVLVPRMTTTQRTAISSPAQGLLVFDVTVGGFYFYNGGWVSLSGPTSAAGGDLSGTYPNPTIASGVITNTNVATGAAIAYNKLALTNSIQNSDITVNAITTSKVANGTVTTAKMADSAITGLQILSGVVAPVHISTAGATSGQVLGYNGTSVAWTTPASGGAPTGTAGGSLAGTYPNPTIASGVITNTNVATGAAITYSKLTLTNSILNSDITVNAITTSKVANGTVTTAKMADSAITGLQILTAVVAPKHISPIGAASGQVLGYNGTSVAWVTPASGGTPNFGTPALKTTNYNIATTDVLVYTVTDGLTFTLPSPSSVAAGKMISIVSGSTNGVTIATAAGNMVFPSSATTTTISTIYQAILVSDGSSNWVCVSSLQN